MASKQTSRIHAYLTFDGNCRQAMMFYRDCLGGDLRFQTVGDSPLSVNMPRKMKDSILHATLQKEDLLLMGSDMVPGTGLLKGNAVSLSLNCSSEKEIQAIYMKLSTGGTRDYPIEDTFWGARFGGLTDRYGYHWLLYYQKNRNV